jgi:hypothetical protein
MKSHSSILLIMEELRWANYQLFYQCLSTAHRLGINWKTSYQIKSKVVFKNKPNPKLPKGNKKNI